MANARCLTANSGHVTETRGTGCSARYWFRWTAPAAALRALEHAGARKRTSRRRDINRCPECSGATSTQPIRDPLDDSGSTTRACRWRRCASARSTARRLKLDARFYVRKGDPATTVARFAKTMRCSEIVMGTRGRGRTAIFVLGSVALRVVAACRSARDARQVKVVTVKLTQPVHRAADSPPAHSG